MREVVQVVAKALVDQPDMVEVTEIDGPDESYVKVRTAPNDLGKLIGRQGRTATAIRTLANVTSEIDGRRTTVDFVDEHK
jgi:predicted RNA-binding protein YlqC (UPF0109 family)